MNLSQIVLTLTLVAISTVHACPSFASPASGPGGRSARLGGRASSGSGYSNPIIYVINHYIRGDEATGERLSSSNSAAIVSKYAKLTSTGAESSTLEEVNGALVEAPEAPSSTQTPRTVGTRPPRGSPDFEKSLTPEDDSTTTATTSSEAPELHTVRVNRPIEVYWESTSTYRNNVTYPGGLCVPGHARHTPCHVHCTDANDGNSGVCTAHECDYVDGACHVRCDRPFDHHEIGCRVECEEGTDETGKCVDFVEDDLDAYYAGDL